jgi:hypothetical protein
MNKMELIKKLEELAYWEDDFIGKYDSEAVWALMKTLPPAKYRQVKELLGENIADTRRHKRVLREAAAELKA